MTWPSCDGLLTDCEKHLAQSFLVDLGIFRLLINWENVPWSVGYSVMWSATLYCILVHHHTREARELCHFSVKAASSCVTTTSCDLVDFSHCGHHVFFMLPFNFVFQVPFYLFISPYHLSTVPNVLYGLGLLYSPRICITLYWIVNNNRERANSCSGVQYLVYLRKLPTAVKWKFLPSTHSLNRPQVELMFHLQ